MANEVKPCFSGELMLAGWRETHHGGATVTFWLPDPSDLDVFRGMTVRKNGIAGQRLACVLVEIGDDDLPRDAENTPAPDPAPAESTGGGEKPYGKQASLLYKSGFFYVLEVLRAIGTDEEFLVWVRQQPCAMTGKFDYNKDEATGETRTQCEAAHVSRIELGRGVNHKPPYAAIPLVNFWHVAQHAHGERVFDTTSREIPNPHGDPVKGRNWMEKKRNAYLVRWASHRLAAIIAKRAGTQYESIGEVPPILVQAWAVTNSVAKYLPKEYLQADSNA